MPPIPAPDSHGRRRPAPVVELPASGRPGRPPRWPLPDPPTPAEAERWRTAWRLPQAVMWQHEHAERLVARWVKLLGNVEGDQPDRYLLAEVRQTEDRLGLSPMALARLGWRIVEDAPTTPMVERRREILARVGLDDAGPTLRAVTD